MGVTIGNIAFLGQNFAKAFDVTFQNASETLNMFGRQVGVFQQDLLEQQCDAFR